MQQQTAMLQQELESLRLRLGELERQAREARADAEDARTAQRKVEDDLSGLSSAYALLEEHSNQLQMQVERFEAQMGAPGDSNPQGASPPGIAEEEVHRRVQAAVAVARDEVQAEADEAMEDLMVCLGQEEAKVALLSERLQAFGVQSEDLLSELQAPLSGEDLT